MKHCSVHIVTGVRVFETHVSEIERCGRSHRAPHPRSKLLDPFAPNFTAVVHMISTNTSREEKDCVAAFWVADLFSVARDYGNLLTLLHPYLFAVMERSRHAAYYFPSASFSGSSLVSFKHRYQQYV